ncbi:MAG: hypothetical protein KBT88_08450, partial [Gammaproteobacteria bacterium]|nr:hypothetical protein [Gammaproteobacteria bacterium]MBQ0839804.1 hypothetical protein [Gammaproteobacteria bacterium]
MIRVTDALNHSAETDYDTQHHPIRARDGLNQQSTRSYRADGLLNSATDASTVSTAFTYDSSGYPNTQQTGSHPAIDSDYSARGELTRLTDGAGAQTTISHDTRGLITSRTDPLNQTATQVY